jgi:hypothetical protein
VPAILSDKHGEAPACHSKGATAATAVGARISLRVEKESGAASGGSRKLVIAQTDTSVGWQRPGGAALSTVLKISLIALALSLLAPSAPVAGAGSPAQLLAGHDAARGEFSINLYRKDDFVPQYTPYWCIGASMQTMLNIIGVTDADGRATQEAYMRLARQMGPSLRVVDHGQTDAGGLRGAGSAGWASGLSSLGAGIYRQQVLETFQGAVETGAYALRKTNRPVGLIVWRGAHAWVMSGFTASADPLTNPSYRITGVYIQDPWYGRVSSIWGAGRRPNTWLSIDALKTALLPRRGGRWHAEQAGKFVLVAPIDPPPRVSLGRVL